MVPSSANHEDSSHRERKRKLANKLGTRVSNAPFERKKWLDPKWLEPKWLPDSTQTTCWPQLTLFVTWTARVGSVLAAGEAG